MRQAIRFEFLVSVAVALWVFSVSPGAFAHNDSGYSHDSSIGYSNPQWMRYVPGWWRLGELSLPGTHDTMARYGGDIVQTQSMSLSTQLNAGVRVLDIRARHIADSFAIHHGAVFQNAYFGSGVMEPLIQFLQTYPSETVLMRVKEEYTPDGNTRSFAETFAWYMGIYGAHVWVPTSNNPTLDEVRGKIVILQDFSGPTFGLSYSALDDQDAFSLGTNWDLYSKWTKVKDHIERAEHGNSNTIYINYLSGSGGSFPYFVASGHSSHGTSAPRLSTGYTTPGWAGTYPDFPRVDCFLGICTIAFEGTNILTRQYIEGGNTDFTGIVMVDFPGRGLIDAIVELNPREGTNITFRGNYGKCLHKKYDDWDNGNTIHMWNCLNTPFVNQTWQYDETTGYIRSAYNPSRCFHKRDDGWNNGNPVHLWDCDAGPAANKTWYYDPGTGHIHAAYNPSKCIHKQDDGWNNGNPIHLWDCDAGPAANKSFYLNAP